MKDAQRQFNNLNISTLEVINVMNDIDTLKVELIRHQELEKELKGMSVQIMKIHKKILDEYKKNRMSF